ncbi:unnamed protein product [Calypogeia fissa]
MTAGSEGVRRGPNCVHRARMYSSGEVFGSHWCSPNSSNERGTGDESIRARMYKRNVPSTSINKRTAAGARGEASTTSKQVERFPKERSRGG